MRGPLVLTTALSVCAQDIFLKQEVSQAAVSKHTCVKKCLDTDETKHFKKCNHDGSADCSKSKCCEDKTNTCFMKNAYWSACAKKCKTGVPDSTGETWDCTALTPSKCSTLQPCVEGCWASSELAVAASSELAVAANASVATKWDCSSFASKAECIAAHCKTPDATLNKMWKGICNDNCPDAPAKKCPEKSFTACIASCGAKSKAPAHGDSCEHDGATNCLKSKCCQNPSDTCYTKNPYWAACTSKPCTKGKPNPLDGQVWDCKHLKPKKTCDPFLFRSCATTCWSQC